MFFISCLTFACDTNANEMTNSFGICVCSPNHTRIRWVCKACDGKNICCWIKLNTNVPFIWNCIELGENNWTSETITEKNAFPMLVAWLIKILMTVILIVCFLVLIVAWIFRTTWDAKKWKDLIKWVAISLALLWASWVILRLVNPNFFG